MRVALLAGGTGGAKLAAGMQEEIGADLTVIANTGDDIETLGVHVSPDPDLVTYWLSGEIDEERGWGIREDSFRVIERMARSARPTGSASPTATSPPASTAASSSPPAAARPTPRRRSPAGSGSQARVLPMSDEPVRTKVLTEHGRRELQEYLILDGGKPEVLGVELEGIAEARADRRGRSNAFRTAEAIVIGPSNPVISIGPILAVPGMREAIAASPPRSSPSAPTSPATSSRGRPTSFMEALGRPTTAAGVASLYAGLIDAMVVDEGDPDPPPADIPTLAAPTLMEGVAGRAAVARTVLDYAESLTARVRATAVVPVKRFAPRRRGSPPGSRRARRPELVAAMVADVLEAIGGARLDRADDRGQPGAGARRSSPPRRAPSCVADFDDAGHIAAALAGIAARRGGRGANASPSCPATARCSTRASSTRC